MVISVEDIAKASEAVAQAEGRSQGIQGFHYDNAHVIRNISAPNGDQELWRLMTEDYETGHSAMMKEIDRLRCEMVAKAVLEAVGAELNG